MKLIPHHQGDKHGHREYRSPDGTWKVVRTRRSGGNRNERPRREVHERHERHADWHCHAAFERRRDPLVFLDTTAVTPGGESMAAAKAVPKQRETPERPVEPHQTPDAEETDHSRHRRNPLRRHPVVAVRRVPVRREAAPAGRRAGDLRKMPAIPNVDPLPETPGSDEDWEEET